MFTRQVIHLSNDEIVCVPWRLGRPLAERRFAASDPGFAAFADYLRDWQNVPTRIAVDLIEEDFRVETLPHLRGRDRAVVLERRLTQLYRGTPFRMAALQGREAAGRRDDIALCTAITQNEGLVACLDALARWRIPVLGVYPAAVLGEPLLRGLRVDAEQLVLVTLLRRDVLRISFFQRGRLKFSRISQPVADDSGGIAVELREEMRRTLQYVGSQAWFLRSTPVRTLLIAEPEDASRLASVWQDTESPLQVIAPATVARRLGLRAVPARSSATGILLHLLMQRPPQEQLAPRERTRDGRLWYVRSLLFAASTLIAACALLFATLDVLDGLSVRDDAARLSAQLAARRGEIAAAQAQLPASAISPDRMSALVRFDRNEVQGVPRLTPFLAELSLALQNQPDLRLRRLVWLATPRRPAPAGSPLTPVAIGARGDNTVLSGLLPRSWYQEVRLEGEIEGDSREPGRAIAAVDRLAADLRRPGLEAAVTRPPYDLSPVHPLASGSVRLGARNPDFVLRLIGSGQP